MKALPSRRLAGPRLFALLLAGQGFLAASLQAHPGHGVAHHGPLHFLGSPYHLAIFALGTALWLAAVLFVKHRVARRALVGAGAAALAAWLLLWIPQA